MDTRARGAGAAPVAAAAAARTHASPCRGSAMREKEQGQKRALEAARIPWWRAVVALLSPSRAEHRRAAMNAATGVALALSLLTDAPCLPFVPRTPVLWAMHGVPYRLSCVFLPSTITAMLFDGGGFITLVLLLLLLDARSLTVPAYPSRVSKAHQRRRLVVYALIILMHSYTVAQSQLGVARIERAVLQHFPEHTLPESRHSYDPLQTMLHSTHHAQLFPRRTVVYKEFDPDLHDAPRPCQFAEYPGLNFLLCSRGLLPGHLYVYDPSELQDHHLRYDVYFRDDDDDEAPTPTGPATCASDKRRPLVVHLHGGGWQSGARQFFSHNYRGGIAGHLVNEMGAVVVSVQYRLGAHGFHGAHMVEDVKDALRDAVARCAQGEFPNVQCDPGLVFLLGTSAGGHLALVVGYQEDIDVAGVINLYGPTELRAAPLLEQSREIGMWTWVYNRVFVEAAQMLCPEDAVEAADRDACFEALSPVHLAERGRGVPTLTVHGEADTLVHPIHAKLLSAALDGTGVPQATVLVPCGDHDGDTRCSSQFSQFAVWSIDHFVSTLAAKHGAGK